MKSRIKKTLALVLTLCMALTLLPLTALAAPDIEIPTVACTVSAPSGGATPNFTGTIDPADVGKYSISSIRWIAVIDDELEIYEEMGSSDTFVSGQKYLVRVRYAAEPGYVFRDSAPFTSGMINGLVGGMAAVTSKLMTFTVKLTATEAGTAPTISTTALGDGQVSAAYSQTLTATGSTPITWTIASGSLPTGLSLVGDTISGTPTTAGTFNFTVKAVNGTSPDATKAFSIVIAVAPVTTFSVTVANGTGSGNYEAGTTVNITADTAPLGQQFDSWTSSGITLANPGNTSTSFTMPANAVTVTATYIALPPVSYVINVQNDGNGTAYASAASATTGATITLTSSPNSGYQFKEWQVISGGISITDNTFTMPTETVTVKAIFELDSTPDMYFITSGANQSWKKGTSTGVSVTSNGDFAKFIGIKVDGILIDAANYIAVSGSTVVTLKASYLETLALGAHTVEFVFSDGSVQTGLTVLKATGTTSPQTGDGSNMLSWLVVLLVSILGCLSVLVWRKWRHLKGTW